MYVFMCKLVIDLYYLFTACFLLHLIRSVNARESQRVSD